MDENQNLDPEQENTTSIPVPDEQTQWGLIRTTPIIEEMERSYLDYAMSVTAAFFLP